LAARSIAWCHRATRHVGIDGTIRELFVEHPQNWPAPPDAVADSRLSKIAKRITSRLEHRGWVPLRCRGLDRAEQEILCQLQGDDVCDQGFEETVWQVVALDAIGHTSECAELERCWTRLQVLIDIDEGENYATCQPATTPLADTSAALQAIISSGARLADYELAGVFDQLMQAATTTTAQPLGPTKLGGLLRTLRQVIEGDTSNASALPPTITILRDEDKLVGNRVGRPPIPPSRINSAAAQLAAQLCRMQRPDGGWAAFPNRGSNGASSPDVTGAAIMALCDWRVEDVDLAIRAGIDFLRHAQQPNGSWDSDTGVRFCHGTTFALQGLLAAKVANDDPAIVAGVNWLLSEQQSGGGWAESPAATLDRATADPSPTQTAWALQALLAAGMSTSASVARGISHLLDTQQATGEWREWQLVLRTCRGESWQQNELLSTCEPLVALARWATQFADEAQHDPFELQLVAAE
jgi:squalene-hopene/tetraprenyl-beta-curcumene cyclase